MDESDHWTNELDIDSDELVDSLSTINSKLEERIHELENQYRTTVDELQDIQSIDDPTDEILQLEGTIREYFDVRERMAVISEALSSIKLIIDEDYWNMVGLKELPDGFDDSVIGPPEFEIDLSDADSDGLLDKPLADESKKDQMEMSLNKVLLEDHKEGLLGDEAGTAMSVVIDAILAEDEPPSIDDLAVEHADANISEDSGEIIEEAALEL